MIRPIRLLASFLTVGAWTLISRVLGFVRDILIAGFLGASPAAQAFLIAFSLPNMFRRFFAEGAFNTAFVPMFSKRAEAGEDAGGFAQDAFAALTGALILLTLLAQVAMPWLVLAMASGFRGDERFDMAVAMGRIAFPYILFISLAALLSGVLNAVGRFAAAAAAPVFLNIILISVILLAYCFGGDVAFAMAWAVPVAGIAQMGLLWWAARRAGFDLRPRWPRMTPELKRLAVIAAPAALAGGVVQINLLVGRQVASYFDGAVAWLSYADRLYQLPLGLVGVAIGVVLLPALSRALKADDTTRGRETFNRANEFALLLTVPAAVALIAVPLPLVSVLFERGAFSHDDARATALAVAVYGAGLPAFVLQKTFQPLFFSREDTTTPFRYALVAMVVNAVVAIALAPVIGFIAAALATTLSAWAMVWLLARGSRRFGAARAFDARLRAAIPGIIAASVVMGISAFVLAAALGDTLVAPGWRYAGLALLVGISGGIYGVTAWALGVLDPGRLRAALKS